MRGDRVTPACDVFCLGSVLAYAATGKLPFGSADSGVHALMYRIAQEEPDLEGVPEGLADLVRACLRKNPEARPGLDHVLELTGAHDTLAEGRSRDPWLPSALVAQLGRHAVQLLETENPEGPEPTSSGTAAGPGAPRAARPVPVPGRARVPVRGRKSPQVRRPLRVPAPPPPGTRRPRPVPRRARPYPPRADTPPPPLSPRPPRPRRPPPPPGSPPRPPRPRRATPRPARTSRGPSRRPARRALLRRPVCPARCRQR
ncbi:hypothetical protein GCM10020256_34370 [Streptomyces thermocoprophilus]